MVEQVADGVLVLELLHTAVHSEQDLVELDCQLEQNSHEPVSVESLEERPHLNTTINQYGVSSTSAESHQVEDEQHLLLSLHQLDQFVPDEVEDAAELVEAAVVPDGVGDGEEVGQAGRGLQVVDLSEVQQLPGLAAPTEGGQLGGEEGAGCLF